MGPVRTAVDRCETELGKHWVSYQSAEPAGWRVSEDFLVLSNKADGGGFSEGGTEKNGC